MDASAEARRLVEAYCQSLVDIGAAQWRINDSGETELHMQGGEVYLFGELGVTRLGRVKTLRSSGACGSRGGYCAQPD
jgi:hypothetical protein